MALRLPQGERESWCTWPDLDASAAWLDLPGMDDVLDAEVEAARDELEAALVRDEAVAAATTIGLDGRPADLAAVVALAAADLATLDADARVAWLAAVGRARAWLEARLDDGLLAVAGHATRLVAEPRGRDEQRRTPAVMVDPDREEVALALRCSPSYADRRITTARRLAALLPGARSALRAGALDHARAEVIADAAADLLRGLPDAADPTGPCPDPALTAVAIDACARLETRVLPRAADRPVGALRRSCARAVHRIDPAGALARARVARRQRDVWLTPETAGTALLCLRLDAVTAGRCQRRLDDAADQLRAQAVADGHPDDGTRIGEWRAEAAAALLLQGRVEGIADAATTVELVMDLPTLLGLADHPAQTPEGEPLPAAMARELLATAGDLMIRRLVTDPVTGHLLDYGRSRYRAPLPLVQFLRARDSRCRFPCCDHRSDARGVDIDHATPWDAGGSTSAANTGPLHRRHHRLKTHHGWRISPVGPDGSVTVSSPHGLTHRAPQTPLLEASLPDPERPPPPF